MPRPAVSPAAGLAGFSLRTVFLRLPGAVVHKDIPIPVMHRMVSGLAKRQAVNLWIEMGIAPPCRRGSRLPRGPWMSWGNGLQRTLKVRGGLHVKEFHWADRQATFPQRAAVLAAGVRASAERMMAQGTGKEQDDCRPSIHFASYAQRAVTDRHGRAVDKVMVRPRLDWRRESKFPRWRPEVEAYPHFFPPECACRNWPGAGERRRFFWNGMAMPEARFSSLSLRICAFSRFWVFAPQGGSAPFRGAASVSFH